MEITFHAMALFVIEDFLTWFGSHENVARVRRVMRATAFWPERLDGFALAAESRNLTQWTNMQIDSLLGKCRRAGENQDGGEFHVKHARIMRFVASVGNRPKGIGRGF